MVVQCKISPETLLEYLEHSEGFFLLFLIFDRFFRVEAGTERF